MLIPCLLWTSRFNITQTFLSDWLTTAQLSLSVQGNELPAIYEGFVRQIAGKRLDDSKDTFQQAVLSFQEQQAIEKRLAQLQQLIVRETQPHRKFELHQQIVELQRKLKA